MHLSIIISTFTSYQKPIAMTKISREDVLQVANQLGYKPTEAQINEVLEMYPSEQESDPSGTWNLVVEQCLSTLNVEQVNATPLEKFLRKRAEELDSDWEDVPMWVINASNEFFGAKK